MTGTTAAAEPKHARLPGWLAVLLNVAVAIIVVALVQAFWVKVYSVPSGSMENTLEIGDRMLVNRTAYPDGRAEQQDVVVFNANEDWAQPMPEDGPLEAVVRGFGDLTGIGRSHEQALVKRVIGEAGQTVSCCTSAGQVVVDGSPQDEPYVYEDLPFVPGRLDCESDVVSSRCFGPVTVPADSMLVMGDHRSNSADSVIACRGTVGEQTDGCARFVRRDDIVGKVFTTVWPPSNWGGH